MNQQNEKKNISLTDVISTAIQVPGVKVNRDIFLRETFRNEAPKVIENISSLGPVEAGCTKEQLNYIAKKIINERTIASTGVSFAAGLPGGLAMAVTVPADLVQFYAVALRMAQELAYLYGEPDLWDGMRPDSEKVTNQLILYCGVMLGASGASQTVRVLSSSLAKQALKKLPQKALTKTFYYPVVKSIAKFFGVNMTKNLFAKGVSKAIPVIGGVVSGGITFATMKPMGNRLLTTLEEAHFGYTEADFHEDWQEIVDFCEEEERLQTEPASETTASSALDQINKAKTMLDDGIISEDEFAAIKAKLISEM